jgi:predicted DNA binding CopG/RHH family protein
MPPKKTKPAESPTLVEVHARFFAEDVEMVKRVAAEKGLPWQIELRLTLRRALKGATEKFLVLGDKP